MQLHGKVAVVTGAGRGLGQAYAKALAAAGAAVVVNDLDVELAEETAQAITQAGGSAVAEGSAIGSTQAAEAIVAKAVAEFGRLDIMVTNAGVLRDRSLLKMEDADFDLVVETHLRGTFTCGRAAARQFKEQGGNGRLILIGSPAGQRASFGQTGYTASKAGIVGLVRTWAAELERSGTTVNAVIPVALTRMVATIPGMAELVELADAGKPLPADVRASGLGTADDVAPLVVFLASDEAAEVTGQAIGAGGDRIAIWSHPTEVVAEVREGGWDADSLAAAFPTTFAPHLQDWKPTAPGAPGREVTAMTHPAMDVDALVAIDVHTHVHKSARGAEHTAEGAGSIEALGEYFGQGGMPTYTVPELAAYYRERKMGCVVFGVDDYTISGDEPVPSNEEVAELAAENADVVIPFASIDPGRGAAGVREARRLVEHYGVRGFKFHPNAQAFFPNDRSAYPLYEVIAEHRLVALFHTGQTGVGAGTRAGGGIRLKYSNPMYVDDVAVDFPDMPIILAHPSFPWQDEALSVATHKPQVYIDLSGWSPKYFPPQLVQYANSLLKDKVLFGSDFPVLTPERWIKDFGTIGIKPDVAPKIMKENAAALFGLRAGAAAAGS